MRTRRSRIPALVGVAVVIGALVGTLTPGAASAERRQGREISFQGESGMLEDHDRRTDVVAPTARQHEIVRSMGGTVRWNRFGTPHSLINLRHYLATDLDGPAATAGRRWLSDNRALFGLSTEEVADLELLNDSPLGTNRAHVLLFRQRFGDLPAAPDGFITLGIAGGKLAYVSSSAAPVTEMPGPARISAVDAFRAAAADVDREVPADAISKVRSEKEWTVFDVSVLSEPGRARLRAMPLPAGGVRTVYETLLMDNDHRRGHPEAYVHFVDAATGQVMRRENRLHFAEAPMWKVFPASPPLSYSSKDTRQLWCWNKSPGCKRAGENRAALSAWDTEVRSGASTFTMIGNSAMAGEAWVSPLTPAENYRPVSPLRTYDFVWTNQWLETKCDFSRITATPARNDIDAAITNLFVMHNRMHDWSYHLGFTEKNYNMQVSNQRGDNDAGGEAGDPEIGNAQAGALTGGQPAYVGRDNANQITPQDGVPPITNMYLWQPVPGAFYSNCVDGDYDMTVIGHEYTHAISNRMVGGPDSGLSGPQAGAMGESWSDLVAVEYLNQYSMVPMGNENPFAVGPYVTADPQAAIRNYGMNHSPLNYSNVGYDITGPQVHADGEIWSAINYDLRAALVRRYNKAFPARNKALQARCADGLLPADKCPGNRRWIQIVFDAWLLMQPQVSMVDSRDAYLAADKMRFKGANRNLLARIFAMDGLGKGVSSRGNNDPDPIPSFQPIFGPTAKVRFQAKGPRGQRAPRNVQFFVGRYEARTMPIADTDPDTPVGETVAMAPGRYQLMARADGFGVVRFNRKVNRKTKKIVVRMPVNLASKTSGAKIQGDGINLQALIDDTEATNWASLTSAGTASPPQDVKGRKVTVDLAGGTRLIKRVKVSAMLRPANSSDPGGDTGSQNRFSALRQFRIDVCRAKGKLSCVRDSDFRKIYVSRKNAFPAIRPRPKAPHLIMRSFNIPNVRATHVRLVVLSNQCTGTPGYRGEQDEDVTNQTDCPTATTLLLVPQGEIVRAAELQVFGR